MKSGEVLCCFRLVLPVGCCRFSTLSIWAVLLSHPFFWCGTAVASSFWWWSSTLFESQFRLKMKKNGIPQKVHKQQHLTGARATTTLLDLALFTLLSGQCTHKHPTALSNLIDPFSRHTLVSPHLHARDHSSNALALAQVSEK